MTRETKVGLLVGSAIILFVAIIVGDYLSVAGKQDPAKLTDFAPQAQERVSVVTPPAQSIAPAQPTSPAPPVVTIDVPAVNPAPPTPEPLELIPVQRERVSEQPTTPQTQPQDVNQPMALLITPPHSEPTYPLTPQPQQVRQAQPTIYFVKSGDSLYSIARQQYGNGDLWRKIADANSDEVGADGQIREGVRLVIPPITAQTTPAPEVTRNSPTPTPTSTRRASGTVTVGPGDTLSALAARHLGSERLWPKLFEANRDRLSSPDDLQAGMTLRLPATATTSTTTPPAATPRRSAPTNTYVVQTGDTLSTIALKTLGSKSRWRDIYEANRDKISKPDQLQAGMELKLPARS